MAKLHIGEGLSLPLDAATQTFAFIARKGGGKTYAAGKLCELLIEASVQCVILDTVGNWYGLRLAADGKSPGLDVPVLGGLRGDIPLQAAAGELAADIVVDSGRSIILDLSQFSLGDRKKFATAFGHRLWQRKKGESQPSPVMLIIEESQLIVPQKVDAGTAQMVGIYEEIIRLGRNYGIGCTMISQRPQSVNKDVLNQTECLFVGQVNGSQERKALKEWVTYQGMSSDLVDELPSLPVGTMYAWSPQWLNILQKTHILPKWTYDASATPKVGDKRAARELKPLDLDDLKEKMAATIERAKAEDPKELRKRIAELERALKNSKAAPLKPASVDPRVMDRAIEHALKLRDKQWRDATRAQHGRAAGLLQGAVDTFRAAGPAAPEDFVLPATSPELVPHQPIPIRAPRPAERPPREAEAVASNNGHLPKGERTVLAAVAQYPEGIERRTLTILTGYKRSTRDTYLQRLAERGYISQSGGLVVATDAGVAALGDFEPLPTGTELLEYWLGRLPEGERKILEFVTGQPGEEVDREAISEATGYARSSRDTYLQRLQARRLVDSSGKAKVRAAEILFG